MGLRTKAYCVGAFLAFFSSMAAALGLGEIKLNSSLNQPLDAEIQLLHVRDLTEGEIVIAIASPEEFARAGVERNFFVTDLKLKLDLNAAHGPVVHVTSAEPVREPFVNFIVSARWPSGRLLREYTLLVDLPVFSGAKSAPVQATSPDRAQPSPSSNASRPAPRTAPRAPVSEAPGSATSFSSDTYGPVGANETLWSIASRVKPDSAVSVQQTMLAIQRMNPEAFINGNINLLRRGQVLRIPDKDEIQQLSTREAIQQVAEQNRSWSGKNTERAQLEGSKNFAQTRDEPTGVEGRVKLSSGTADASSGQGVGSEGEGGARVSDALNQAQEELDAADRENAELKSRIQSMEEQIQTMERLVEVSSEEMRALELAAQQANQTGDESAVDAETGAGESTAEASSQQAEPTATTEQPQSESVQPQSEPAPAQSEPPKAQPPVKPAPVQKSLVDIAMDNILYIGIGLGVLVLAAVLYLFKRKREDEFEDYDDYETSGDGDLVAVGDAEIENDKTVPLHDFNDGGDFVEEEYALAEAETEDVVGECDIHIAYGQYDQAEEKLLRALEKDPSNTPVRLKLLEVFALQGDADSFDQHFARLHAMGDSDAVERAAVIRSSIEGIEPFDPNLYDTDRSMAAQQQYDVAVDSAFDTSDALADDTLDFDFNDVDDLVDSSSSVAVDKGAQDSLDFDLTLDDDDITRIPSHTAATKSSVAAEDQLADLDFELDSLNGDSADLDDLDLEFTGDDDAVNNSTDLDFQLPEDEVSEDQAVDLEDTKAGDDFASEFDLDFEEDERLTNEFANDLVAERAQPQAEEESFDFADLNFDEGETSSDLRLSNEQDALDFDLDKDLEDAQAFGDEPPLLSSAAAGADSDLGDLGLNDLERLDMAEEDLELESERAATANRSAEAATDFDMDFDLDKDINLDELDHELDALAADFSGNNASMEEPVLDFDDDLEAHENTVAMSSADSPEDQDLDDLLAVDELKPEPVPVAAKSQAAPMEAANSSMDFEIPDFDPENDDDSNLDFLSDNDETATKLDLARAYIDMGDSDGAKDILDEIMDEGNDQQKREAESLLARIG